MTVELLGHHYVAFKDGNSAFQYLDSDLSGPHPDVALIDIRMPGPWGHDVSAKLRKTPGLKDIPVLLMTAYELDRSEIETYIQHSGADRLIYKPLPPFEELEQIVQDIRSERKERLSRH